MRPISFKRVASSRQMVLPLSQPNRFRWSGLLAMLLTAALAFWGSSSQAQYSVVPLTNQYALSSDTSSQFSFGSPIATDGTTAAFSTGDSLWSIPQAGGTPKQIFQLGTVLPGSGAVASAIYGYVAVDQGVAVFEAEGTLNSQNTYGIYAIKADGSLPAVLVADSTQIPGEGWGFYTNVFGLYKLFAVNNGQVVFDVGDALYRAGTDGSGYTTLWQTTLGGGFTGCVAQGEYNSVFTVAGALYPVTDGTSYAFFGQSDLSYAGLYAAPLTTPNTCNQLTNNVTCNICGPVTSLPGQPQPGTAFSPGGGAYPGTVVQIDGGYVYFQADAPGGVSSSEDYLGIFKVPLAGGPVTPVVTNISPVPGFQNSDGSYAQLRFGGVAVRNGKVLFLASDYAQTKPFSLYEVQGNSYTLLLNGATSVSGVCIANLTGNLSGLNPEELTADGHLVFYAHYLAAEPEYGDENTGPDQNGNCPTSLSFFPSGYYVLDTNHPLIPTSTSLSINPTQDVTITTPMTLTIQVGASNPANNPNSMTPTGTVTAWSVDPRTGTQQPGMATLDGQGRATIRVTEPGTDGVGAVYNFTVAYGGDTNFSSSISNLVVEDVHSVTRMQLTATPAMVGYGTPVNLIASLQSGDSETSIAFPNQVTFLDGGKAIGSASVDPTANTATLSTTLLGGGPNTITAQYPGDSLNSAVTSNMASVTVGQVSSTTSLSANPMSTTFGLPVMLIAKVPPAPGGAVPTGSVTFSSGMTGLGSMMLDGTGTATVTTTGLPLGPDPVTATYLGDGNYLGSNAPAITVTINPAPAAGDSVSVASASASAGSRSAQLDAAVSYTGSAPPAGAVTFTVNSGTPVPANCLVSAGLLNCAVTFGTPSLAAGSYPIVVNVAADSNYPTVSGQGTLTITPVTSGTDSVTVPAQSFGVGAATSPLVATVTFSGPQPNAAVVFQVDNAQPMNATCNLAVGGGSTSCTVQYPTAGLTAASHTITVSALPDGVYPPTQATGALTPGVVKPTVAITVPPQTTAAGSSVVSITVSATFETGVFPTGTAVVTLDGANPTNASCSLTSYSSASCTAQVPAPGLSSGSHTIGASISGDANYSSSSGSGTLTVQ